MCHSVLRLTVHGVVDALALWWPAIWLNEDVYRPLTPSPRSDVCVRGPWTQPSRRMPFIFMSSHSLRNKFRHCAVKYKYSCSALLLDCSGHWHGQLAWQLAEENCVYPLSNTRCPCSTFIDFTQCSMNILSLFWSCGSEFLPCCVTRNKIALYSRIRLRVYMLSAFVRK